MIKVSIIVPVYNAEQYIVNCIKSILAQKYLSFELILVDDGSQDESLSICNSFAIKDSRIKIYSKSNGGVSSTRNYGLDRATGEWVMFVDSDDTINPDTLQSLVEKVECDKMIVCCGAKYDNGEDYFVFHDLYVGSVDSDELGHVLLYGPPWGKLYNRNVIERNNLRFDESISKSEDTLFFWQYMNCISNVATTSYIGYNYYRPQTMKRQSLANRLTDPFVLLKTEKLLSIEYNRLQRRFQVSNDRNSQILQWFNSIMIEALSSCYWLQLPSSKRYKIWQLVDSKLSMDCQARIIQLFRKYPYVCIDCYFIIKTKIKNIIKSLS